MTTLLNTSSPLGIARSLDGRRIFITGPPASWGECWLKSCSGRRRKSGSSCLIRSDRERGAEERLRQDAFGLDRAAYAALCGSIDMVVASAATVDSS